MTTSSTFVERLQSDGCIVEEERADEAWWRGIPILRAMPACPLPRGVSMSPYQRAQGWHLAGGWHWSFEQIIAAHAYHGGEVHITPEVFVLARPVCRAWPEEWICDPQRVAAREVADCWHVWLLAGDAGAAVRYLPYELPFMSWHRRGKWRVHGIAGVVELFGKAGSAE